MKTSLNRPLVLAKFLRASVAQLKRSELLDQESDDWRAETLNAYESIDAVAEALEEQGTAPDPAEAPRA